MKFTFRFMLLRRAYTTSQFQTMLDESGFGGAWIESRAGDSKRGLKNSVCQPRVNAKSRR